MTWTCCPNTTDTTEGWVPCDPCADGEHACCTHPAAVDGVGPDTVIVGCCCAGHEQGID